VPTTSTFPATLDTFTNPGASDTMDASPALYHDVQHTKVNDALAAIEATVGATANTDTNTVQGLLKALRESLAPCASLQSSVNTSGDRRFTSGTVNFGLAYGASLWVFANGTGNVFSSSDRRNWSQLTLPVSTSSGGNAVAFLNGRFLVGTSNSAGVNYSTDGITWSAGTGMTVGPRAFAYGASTWVSLNGSTSTFTSTDGIAWTARTIASGTWTGCAFGASLFVAVSSSGTVYSSPDGITWTARTAPNAYAWSSVAWNGSLFVAVARSGTGNRVMTSPDGITWTARTTPADLEWASVSWFASKWVAIASAANGVGLMTSTDGITWTQGQIPDLGNASNALTAQANDGTNLMTVSGSWPLESTNGTTWTCPTVDYAPGCRSMTFANSLWVMTTLQPLKRVATSTDGLSWTPRATPQPDVAVNGVAYGNSIWVIVGDNGFVATSPDGATWTLRTAAASNNWTTVSYGAGLFVAMSSTGTGNRVMTSPDGITWTIRTSPADYAWQRCIFAAGLFVAVANTGAVTGRAATSSDGITWTLRALPAIGAWGDVAHNGTVFMAVANQAYSTSSDGITWNTVYYSQNTLSVAAVPGFFLVTTGSFQGISADAIKWSCFVVLSTSSPRVASNGSVFCLFTSATQTQPSASILVTPRVAA
jgi:hypothetical protein